MFTEIEEMINVEEGPELLQIRPCPAGKMVTYTMVHSTHPRASARSVAGYRRYLSAGEYGRTANRGEPKPTPVRCAIALEAPYFGMFFSAVKAGRGLKSGFSTAHGTFSSSGLKPSVEKLRFHTHITPIQG